MAFDFNNIEKNDVMQDVNNLSVNVDYSTYLESLCKKHNLEINATTIGNKYKINLQFQTQLNDFFWIVYNDDKYLFTLNYDKFEFDIEQGSITGFFDLHHSYNEEMCPYTFINKSIKYIKDIYAFVMYCKFIDKIWPKYHQSIWGRYEFNAYSLRSSQYNIDTLSVNDLALLLSCFCNCSDDMFTNTHTSIIPVELKRMLWNACMRYKLYAVNSKTLQNFKSKTIKECMYIIARGLCRTHRRFKPAFTLDMKKQVYTCDINKLNEIIYQ